jgi:hypothetical protein
VGRFVRLRGAYFDDAAATAAALVGQGWLRTGDLGSMDEHGYCRVQGRLKDMISPPPACRIWAVIVGHCYFGSPGSAFCLGGSLLERLPCPISAAMNRGSRSSRNWTHAPQQKSHHSITVGTREQHGRRYGTTSTIFRSTSVN